MRQGWCIPVVSALGTWVGESGDGDSHPPPHSSRPDAGVLISEACKSQQNWGRALKGPGPKNLHHIRAENGRVAGCVDSSQDFLTGFCFVFSLELEE